MGAEVAKKSESGLIRKSEFRRFKQISQDDSIMRVLQNVSDGLSGWLNILSQDELFYWVPTQDSSVGVNWLKKLKLVK